MNATVLNASVFNPSAISEADAKTRDPLQLILEIVREQGLSSGDQLPSIRELADRLEVKPTVVRDALLQGQGRGMFKILPRSGAFLCRDLSELSGTELEDSDAKGDATFVREGNHNLFHLLDARRVVELELIGRAARERRLEELLPLRRALDEMLQLPAEATREEHVRLDILFHREIARLGGNEVLAAIQANLLELLQPHLDLVPRSLQRRKLTDRSHVAIYDALVKGDPEAARRELSEHLSLAYDGLLRDLQQIPRIDLPEEGAATGPRNKTAPSITTASTATE